MDGRIPGAFVGAAALTAVATYLVRRPAMLRWGTQGDEATEPLPGDDRVPHPTFQSTRAITIDAPPEEVWPWVVQMGIHRAGFYTHDRLERALFRARYVEGRHSATRIHPELQDLRVGDLVPYGAGVEVEVSAIEENRHLVLGEAFVLRPLPGGRTRFLVRYRGHGYLGPAFEALSPDAPAALRGLASVLRHTPGATLLLRAVDVLVGDPLHHYMDVGLLRGLKARAEGAHGDARAVEPVASPA